MQQKPTESLHLIVEMTELTLEKFASMTQAYVAYDLTSINPISLPKPQRGFN